MNSKRSSEEKERIHVYPFWVRCSSCALMTVRLGTGRKHSGSSRTSLFSGTKSWTDNQTSEQTQACYFSPQLVNHNQLQANRDVTKTLKSYLFLLIKYTILEQMSRKISLINFSFIRQLYVGNDFYVTMSRYLQVATVRREGAGGAGV